METQNKFREEDDDYQVTTVKRPRTFHPEPKPVDAALRGVRPVSDGDKDLGVKTGVVKSFGEYDRTGFGHLLDSNNHEYFVHYSDIVGSGFKNLARGQHVKFHAYEGPKGLFAKEVRVIMV